MRGRVFMDYIEIIIWSVFLAGFSIWFSALSAKLQRSLNDIEIADDKVEEISEQIMIVTQILQQLPQLMPQFNMNTSPLQPLIDMVRERWASEQGSLTEQQLRDDTGRFSDGTKEE